MIKKIQIKAMSEEEAKKRALNILEAKEYQITEIKILEKPKSFLGLFSKNGIFQIYIDTEKTEQKIVKPSKQISKKVEERKQEKKIEVQPIKKVKEEKVLSENSETEEMVLEKVKNFIQKIGLDLEIQCEKIKEKHYKIQLTGEDNGIIIGKKGKTLHSLEYLINSMYKEYKFEIDVEGFKEKRIQTLKDLAKKMANKCIKTKKTIRLNAMPAKERKIIHEILNTYPELETFSEGRDPKRYIVIKYKKR